MNYPLPQRSQTAYKKHKDQYPQNAGLIFDRFLPDLSKLTHDKEAKKKALQTVANFANHKTDKNLLSAWQSRWEQTVKAAYAQPFSLKTDWRFITGLGRGGPMEVGFTFHRYGFPIIPGSGLKGLARSWGFYQIAPKLGMPPELWKELEDVLLAEDTTEKKAQQEALEKLLKNEKLPQDAPICQQGLAAAGELPWQWQQLFGTQNQAGLAVFFDAIPVALPALELDIMNPHYSKYYQHPDREPPADSDTPIPVYFLTVAPNTEFCFAVGWRKAKIDSILHKLAEDWLKVGLTELGGGAKTSAGYGYFLPEQKSAAKSKPDETKESATPPQPKAKPVWHTGIIRKIDPSRTQRGIVEDAKTSQTYTFPVSVIKGNTPGKKARVKFALLNGKVVEVRRL